MPSDNQPTPYPRVATAQEVRAVLAWLDKTDRQCGDVPMIDGQAAIRVIRAQQAAIAKIVAARQAVWDSAEGTTEGYAAHGSLREAISAAAAMLRRDYQ